ncbi:hypothetical protein J5491_00110 [Candidatus Saccharibacteria bacterium]|nr:hypothetical protein [Candidatus Saccharibacteria bacterium]
MNTRKLGIVVLFTAFFIGFLIICAPIVKADPVKKDRVRSEHLRTSIATPLQSGNVDKAISSYLLPLYRELAKGEVLGDKYSWDFEKAPFYAEHMVEGLAKQNMKNFCFVYVNDVNYCAFLQGEEPIGLFDIFKVEYTSEIRKIKDANGDTAYRCALTSIFVKEWCTPDGIVCSREKAVGYFKKAENQKKTLVSKIIKCRRKGKPLTICQRLKYIHDWLVLNVDYDCQAYESLKKGGKKKSAYNEYGALIKGKAICQGYAYAFKALVDELIKRTGAKIECEIVTTTENYGGEGHAWNRVKINGKWYHIDVTWDDPEYYEGESETMYFLVSDRALSGVHPGGYGYCTYNPIKATDRKYEGKNWPILFKEKISGIAKSTKKYKLGKKKAVRPFDALLYPFTRSLKYAKRSTNLKVSKLLALQQGEDYTVKYKNNRKKGWATAIIKLKGRYEGKIIIRFKIVK